MEETIGKKVNTERAQEALATGAQRIAVACPFCYVMMDDGVKGEGKDEEVVVSDIAEVILEALERRAPRPPRSPRPSRRASDGHRRRVAESGAEFGVAEAVDGVVVHHAHRLHERVHGGGSDEPEASPLEVLAERRRDLGRARGRSAAAASDSRSASRRRTTTGTHRNRRTPARVARSALCVVDDRADLGAVAHDRAGRQQLSRPSPDVKRAILAGSNPAKQRRYPSRLCENGPPRQAGLGAFERELLEEADPIVLGNAPLHVVVARSSADRSRPRHTGRRRPPRTATSGSSGSTGSGSGRAGPGTSSPSPCCRRGGRRPWSSGRSDLADLHPGYSAIGRFATLLSSRVR